MNKELTCIICPRGCHLIIDENNNVSGNHCIRGKNYAISEITCPMRTITSSIRVINREDLLVSVKTSDAIPKEKMFEVMKIINKTTTKAPVKIGDVVVHNLLNLNIDLLITKNIK